MKTCEEIEPVVNKEKAVVNATTNKRVRQDGISCIYCKENSHKSFECKQVSTEGERKEILKKEKRCFNCTRTGHTVSECKSRSTCYHCRGKHHSSICSKLENPSHSDGKVNVHPGLHIKNGTVAYQTVQAKIGGHQCRILLDSGRGGSYISREQGRKLRVKPARTEQRIIRTVNGEMEVRCPIYNLQVESIGKSNDSFTTEFAQLDMYMLSSIPNSHPEIQKRRYPHMKSLWFSDVSKEDTLPIHAIIGAKDFSRIKTGKIVRGNRNEPIAEETALGWTIMGAVGDDAQEKTFILNTTVEIPRSIETEIKQLWDIDVLGVSDGTEDVYESFTDQVARDQDGRYSVRLPWRRGNFYLPENKRLCEDRLKQLHRKLQKTPQILEQYNAIIQEQEAEGIVEPVPESPDGLRVSYIPHHPMIRKDAETTKLRIVYDASAKDRKYNHSLNDCLHVGPSLLPLMFDILLRFRLFPVAILGDIQKAFLQIQVDQLDRDCLRFLWFEDIKAQPLVIKQLRFKRVLFGSGPSPFLLNATIREHMKLYAKSDPEFVKQVLNSLYVDDYVGGCDTVQEAVQLKQKLEETFCKGKFHMRKWKTNNTELRNIIQQDSHESQEQAETIKVLRVLWDTNKDTIAVDFKNNSLIAA